MARSHFLKNRARALRQNATDGESALWFRLRNRQIGGAKFRRQTQIDGYIADFLCPELRLIIELDGGQHTPEGDAQRTVYLEGQNFTILRFWNTDVLTNMDGVLTVILNWIHTQRSKDGDMPPHPNC